MHYVNLGRTGLKVSRLCLGTMNFGPQTTEPDSFAIMDQALELGINFFDTADVYGWKPGEGVTERILGNWFAQGGGRREKTVLATKVYGNMDAPDAPDPNLARGLNARKIIFCCEASLQRMKTDWIDLYQMHHVARDCPWDEIWQAFDALFQQGKIRYAGSSNFAGWHIASAQAAAAKRPFMGLVSEQSKYSLETRHIELEVLPSCRHHGLGVIAWSPLAGGLLAGVLGHRDTAGRRADPKFQANIDKHRPKLERWEALCKQVGEEPANVALAWLLHQKGMTGPIIGPRTVAQLAGSLRCLEIKLDELTLRKIDEIWPGPGGEAPEAYAW